MFGDLRHVGDMLKRNALKYRDEEALVFEDTRLSWHELNANADKFAHALRKLGVKQGDFISIYSENNHQYVEVMFGAGKAGVCVANINYRLVASEAEHIVRDSGSKAILFSAHLAGEVGRIREGAPPSLKSFIGIGERGDWFPDYEELIAQMLASEFEGENPIRD